ncbi:MAG: hypothetical protein LAKADJCE_00778 [Candidatus Argoarchaeum ethanivorans]|uniref:CN hydrolase domain-containing protein n=1 Tax=Candidatus Argoarchaeum ethanivorans TaxID=2608793 RepID=A0A811TAH8_9EURY|nr:MAG: hypothetical protein LAKADJCE_00778 [Candidatus Argoarchaeum ethanivorans]
MKNNSMLRVASVQIRYDLEHTRNIWTPVWDDRYKEKILTILDFLKGKTDCIVFPELSIPFEMLSDLKEFADCEETLIIAGSHYVESKNIDRYNQLFSHQFDEKKDVRKNICPILAPNQKILHIEKINPARDEDIGYDEFGLNRGELHGIFILGDYTLGILICSDFLNPDLRSRILKKANLVLVPQFNSHTKRFYDLANSEFENPNNIVRAVMLTNATGKKAAGGSAVFRNVSREDQKMLQERFGYPYAAIILPEKIKEELIISINVNMDYSSERTPSSWTPDQHPIDYKLIPIIQKNEPIINIVNSINKANNVQSCIDTLNQNKEFIGKTSTILSNNTQNLENLTLEEVKEKCHTVVIQ